MEATLLAESGRVSEGFRIVWNGLQEAERADARSTAHAEVRAFWRDAMRAYTELRPEAWKGVEESYPL